MNELNIRVAVEIMGEPQPTWQAPKTPTPLCVPEASEAWWRSSWNHDWKPHPFSTSLEYAMKAVDKYLDTDERTEAFVLRLSYDKWLSDNRWSAHLEDMQKEEPYADLFGDGDTVPEAICNLLLALKEKPAGGVL